MQPAEALERTWDVHIVGVQNSLAGRELVYQRFFWVGTFVVVEALGQSRLIPCLLTQQTCLRIDDLLISERIITVVLVLRLPTGEHLRCQSSSAGREDPGSRRSWRARPTENIHIRATPSRKRLP